MAKCPVCGKPAEVDYQPFCSRRCADVDLQRWLTGRYAIAGDAEDDVEVEEGSLDTQGPGV